MKKMKLNVLLIICLILLTMTAQAEPQFSYKVERSQNLTGDSVIANKNEFKVGDKIKISHSNITKIVTVKAVGNESSLLLSNQLADEFGIDDRADIKVEKIIPLSIPNDNIQNEFLKKYNLLDVGKESDPSQSSSASNDKALNEFSKDYENKTSDNISREKVTQSFPLSKPEINESIKTKINDDLPEIAKAETITTSQNQEEPVEEKLSDKLLDANIKIYPDDYDFRPKPLEKPIPKMPILSSEDPYQTEQISEETSNKPEKPDLVVHNRPKISSTLPKQNNELVYNKSEVKDYYKLPQSPIYQSKNEDELNLVSPDVTNDKAQAIKKYSLAEGNSNPYSDISLDPNLESPSIAKIEKSKLDTTLEAITLSDSLNPTESVEVENPIDDSVQSSVSMLTKNYVAKSDDRFIKPEPPQPPELPSVEILINEKNQSLSKAKSNIPNYSLIPVESKGEEKTPTTIVVHKLPKISTDNSESSVAISDDVSDNVLSNNPEAMELNNIDVVKEPVSELSMPNLNKEESPLVNENLKPEIPIENKNSELVYADTKELENESPIESPTVNENQEPEIPLENKNSELVDANTKDLEKPSLEKSTRIVSPNEDIDIALDNATEEKPDLSSYKNIPQEEFEYDIAMEPSAPKPPVQDPKEEEKNVIVEKPTEVAKAPEKPIEEPIEETKAPEQPVEVAKVPEEPTNVVPKASFEEGSRIIGDLEKGKYYIQIGAYKTEQSASEASEKLGKNFLILVQKVNSNNSNIWKVFVGPLSRDESGVVLMRVRSLGYKDAFVKTSY